MKNKNVILINICPLLIYLYMRQSIQRILKQKLVYNIISSHFTGVKNSLARNVYFEQASLKITLSRYIGNQLLLIL